MPTSQNSNEAPAGKMQIKDLSFDQLMQIYNHIGEEERHFNSLEMEYRKLASQWLLVTLGAIGYLLSKQQLILMNINVWVLVIGICIAACIGILVLWLLDLKVYHELLHSAFREGVLLEDEFPILPQIRNNMVKSQRGGDIITRVILYYFFSVLLLLAIANISIWMLISIKILLCITINIFTFLLLITIYKIMIHKSSRYFYKPLNKVTRTAKSERKEHRIG